MKSVAIISLHMTVCTIITQPHRVCYERVPFSPTMATMILSAWWHGFYPGYYFAFIFFSIGIEVARKVRGDDEIK